MKKKKQKTKKTFEFEEMIRFSFIPISSCIPLNCFASKARLLFCLFVCFRVILGGKFDFSFFHCVCWNLNCDDCARVSWNGKTQERFFKIEMQIGRFVTVRPH